MDIIRSHQKDETLYQGSKMDEKDKITFYKDRSGVKDHFFYVLVLHISGKGYLLSRNYSLISNASPHDIAFATVNAVQMWKGWVPTNPNQVPQWACKIKRRIRSILVVEQMKTRKHLLKAISVTREFTKDPDVSQYKKRLYQDQIRLLQWILGFRLHLRNPKGFPSRRSDEAWDRLAFFREQQLRKRLK